MRCDIVLAGVGGQGVLSMATLIGRAAVLEGLNAKQSEVHGMAQRGGAVQAHLRLSDTPIASDLIPNGTAAMILSLEPVEALRYLSSLAPYGTVITSASPFVNIPDYPDVERVLQKVRELPHAIVIEAQRLAEDSGDPRSVNTVMVGAAAHLLPLRLESLDRALVAIFGPKGDDALRVNRTALRVGARAVAASGQGVSLPPRG